MNAPANIRAEAVRLHVVVIEDPEVLRLEHQVALLAAMYRRLSPALIAVASILGAIIAVAHLMKWIGR